MTVLSLSMYFAFNVALLSVTDENGASVLAFQPSIRHNRHHYDSHSINRFSLDQVRRDVSHLALSTGPRRMTSVTQLDLINKNIESAPTSSSSTSRQLGPNTLPSLISFCSTAVATLAVTCFLSISMSFVVPDAAWAATDESPSGSSPTSLLLQESPKAQQPKESSVVDEVWSLVDKYYIDRQFNGQVSLLVAYANGLPLRSLEHTKPTFCHFTCLCLFPSSLMDLGLD